MLLLTKAVFAVMIGFISSVILGTFLVPILKKMHIGQKISIFVGESHRKKEGTPTMGGIIFIVPTILITLFLLALGKIEYTDNLGIVLFVFLAYAILGFIDDFLSIKKKNNEGLTTPQKFIWQVLIALVVFYMYMKMGGSTSFIVGTLGINVEMGWLYGLFILFVLVGSSNAVNITDGLDGLAGSLSAIAFVAFALISLFCGFEDMGIFTLILTGCIGGFLIFNGHPARIFMGDTGSLALGGVMATIAILTHRELTLLVVAGVFVIETISVILQIMWLHLFHHKLFLMTPLHHHFE
ncbi:MAG: phospho-N-acetylmuramoyl-pentapeptide-transferase, partial [Bacilli bacterium]